MNNKTTIEPFAKEIADFLNQLPDEPIEIMGIQSTNELFINGKQIKLAKSIKVRNHSPTGFNWGYGGSGPAQSALAILLEFVEPKIAQTYYQDFKWGWVGGLPQADFLERISLRQIMSQIIFK